MAAEETLRQRFPSIVDPAARLAARQARLAARITVSMFYGTPQRARARFDAYIAKRVVLARLVKILVPTEHHIVVVGDAGFNATQRGLPPGAAGTLLRALKAIEAVAVTNPDQKTGVDIVRRAIQAPARQIAINAGADGSIVVGKILEKIGRAHV